LQNSGSLKNNVCKLKDSPSLLLFHLHLISQASCSSNQSIKIDLHRSIKKKPLAAAAGQAAAGQAAAGQAAADQAAAIQATAGQAVA
jgi:hypothetical protein